VDSPVAQNKTSIPSVIPTAIDLTQSMGISASSASKGLLDAAKLAEDVAYEFAANLDADSLTELIVAAADLTRLSDVMRRMAARQV